MCRRAHAVLAARRWSRCTHSRISFLRHVLSPQALAMCRARAVEGTRQADSFPKPLSNDVALSFEDVCMVLRPGGLFFVV